MHETVIGRMQYWKPYRASLAIHHLPYAKAQSCPALPSVKGLALLKGFWRKKVLLTAQARMMAAKGLGQGLLQQE
jgi:hypothetical protein